MVWGHFLAVMVLVSSAAAAGAVVGRAVIQQITAGRSTAKFSLSSATWRTTSSVKSVPL